MNVQDPRIDHRVFGGVKKAEYLPEDVGVIAASFVETGGIDEDIELAVDMCVAQTVFPCYLIENGNVSGYGSEASGQRSGMTVFISSLVVAF